MTKGAPQLRQNDIKRAIAAVTKAGLKVGRIEIDPLRIVIHPDNGEGTPHWDAFENWRANRDAK
jgi:hypothetical protein